MARKILISILCLVCLGMIVTRVWSTAWHGTGDYLNIRLGNVNVSYGGYRCDVVVKVSGVLNNRTAPRLFKNYRWFGYTLDRGWIRGWCPFWFVFALCACYPSIVLTRYRLRQRATLQRQLQGLCTVCGYDLTGLTMPRCPECSTSSQCKPISSRVRKLVKIETIVILFVGLGIVNSLFYVCTITLLTFLFSQNYVGEYLIETPIQTMISILWYTFYIGFILGPAWTLFAILLFYRKSLSGQTKVLMSIVAALGFFHAIVGYVYPIVGYIFLLIPTALLFIICLFLRRTLPNDD